MRAPGLIVLATDEAVRSRAMRVARVLDEVAWPAATPAEAAEELRRNDGVGVLVADIGPAGASLPELMTLMEDHPHLVGIVAVPAAEVAGLGPAATRLRWLPSPWEDAVLLQALRDACECRRGARELRRSSVLLRRRTRQLARADERARERVNDRTQHLSDALARAQRASRDAAKLLAAAAEQNDPALRGHGERVARRAAAIAEVLGISNGERGPLREACMLQATLLDGVSHEPADGLGADERRLVEERVEAAGCLAQALGHEPAAVRALVHARERWDGRGLPVGLRGAATPLLARVVAVAEAHVALVQGRGGRRPARPPAAQQALVDGAGTAFDPEIVDALLRVLWREEQVARRMLEAAVGRT